MEYLNGETSFKLKNSAVALGNFDGIHKGHQLLIKEIVKMKEKNYKATIFTFSPHPKFVLSDKYSIELIYSQEERKQKFEKLGIDIVIDYPFTKDTALMSPNDFVEKILIDLLDVNIIAVGSDYRFGNKRKGDINLLKEYSKKYGFEVIVFEKMKIKDEIISSSKIRKLISKGKIEIANELLGDYFTIIGEVVQGKKLGRKLGTPTANIIPIKNKILPLNGVYVSKTIVNDKEYNSITNIGYNPTTIQNINKSVETYIFDFNNDIYGNNIEVKLLKFLRKENKFNNLVELQNQMNEDINKAQQFFLHSYINVYNF